MAPRQKAEGGMSPRDLGLHELPVASSLLQQFVSLRTTFILFAKGKNQLL
jgi:hypothetical protein